MVLVKNIRSLTFDRNPIKIKERIKFAYKEYKCIIIIDPYDEKYSVIRVYIYKNKKSKTLSPNPIYEIQIPLYINAMQQYNGLYYNDLFRELKMRFKGRYAWVNLDDILQQCAKTLAHITHEEISVNIFGV